MCNKDTIKKTFLMAYLTSAGNINLRAKRLDKIFTEIPDWLLGI